MNHCIFSFYLTGGFGFGVIADMTIRTYPSPPQVILVKGQISTKCKVAFKELLELLFVIYKEDLVGPHWGDAVRVKVPGKHSGEEDKWTIQVDMKAVDITVERAKFEWASFIKFVQSNPAVYTFENKKYDVLKFLTMPGNTFWSRANPSTVPTLEDDFEPHAAYNWGDLDDPNSEQYKYWLQFTTRNLRNDQILTNPKKGVEKLTKLFEELGDLPSTSRLSIVFKGEDNTFNCASHELAQTPMARMNESFGMIWGWIGVRKYHPDLPLDLQKKSEGTSYDDIMENFCGKGRNLDDCEASERMKKAFGNFRKATPGAGSYFNLADYFEHEYYEEEEDKDKGIVFGKAFWGEEVRNRFGFINIP